MHGAPTGGSGSGYSDKKHSSPLNMLKGSWVAYFRFQDLSLYCVNFTSEKTNHFRFDLNVTLSK